MRDGRREPVFYSTWIQGRGGVRCAQRRVSRGGQGRGATARHGRWRACTGGGIDGVFPQASLAGEAPALPSTLKPNCRGIGGEALQTLAAGQIVGGEGKLV